jgi:hypothetical protein
MNGCIGECEAIVLLFPSIVAGLAGRLLFAFALSEKVTLARAGKQDGHDAQPTVKRQ